MAKITIVTDAWHPQVNGVVRSLDNTIDEMRRLGHEIMLVTPDRFRNIPLPSYPEIRIALTRYRTVEKEIDKFQPSYVHIATEGPLGYYARKWCLKNKMPFSTSYHTRFPEYVTARIPIPASILYGMVRNFHNAGNVCMVATASLEAELTARGFKNLKRWSRGIDHNLYKPQPLVDRPFGLPRPIFMQVGRIAVEKNIEAFLELDLPGSKVVVGDGPAREKLQKAYSDTLFTGAKFGQELAEHYAQADVFVFPSKTDTFGNVILEALAAGAPVAAYPVTGPADILGGHPKAGALDSDLREACLKALDCSREAARALAETYTWEAATRQFLENVMRANGVSPDEIEKAYAPGLEMRSA
ncbi:glycosyltransferase family 4 protein [Rhizobium sp. G21]|uniref:glycosyltransferase family 4 protein n=1 Tax=Rhizobium sp. G21 TaxID=2758439 RepID=UPI00160397E8|nr:glycosyltransferase family 1 protein [Rhizobium sp. G21]MBB1250350.1 glycosyltransferase family 1 protein [Rhizobium sp. G21]